MSKLLRCLLWAALWIVCLGSIDADVKYSDGLKIKWKKLKIWRGRNGI